MNKKNESTEMAWGQHVPPLFNYLNTGVGDDVGCTIERQKAPTSLPHVTLENVRSRLSEILKICLTEDLARCHLEEAENLVGFHRSDAKVSMLWLQIKEQAKVNSADELAKQWAALLQVNPQDAAILRLYVRYLMKLRRNAEVPALIDLYLPENIEDADAALVRAGIMVDARLYDESDVLFRKLIGRYNRPNMRVLFAKNLHKRGLLYEAVEVLAPLAEDMDPESRAGKFNVQLMDDYEFFCRLEPLGGVAGNDISMLSLKHALLYFRDREIIARPRQPQRIGLVTGSLGPGGAERQLARLACSLQNLGQSRQQAGDKSLRPLVINVLVKRYTATDAEVATNKKLDFFLNDLLDAKIKVTEINNLPVSNQFGLAIRDPDFLRLLEYLPAQVRYGLTRLFPYFHEHRFDVASLWQDGTCIFGALAALLAGVPVIHLVFRGLPPNLRSARDKPEYHVLYRALAEVPGVYFMSNSKVIAQEYAQWLGLPIERFHILYNGVPVPAITAPVEEERKWLEFAERTQDATETIGGVFRLEPDKQPHTWIRLVHRYLQRRPRARFVLVGDGRLLESIHTLVNELGIQHRLLLVGLSRHVGFWYSKMDVKVLLSLFEGLPNVLIEAQLLGVLTVSTPAGGSGECFTDGLTGHLLSRAENPDLDEACDKISLLTDSVRSNAEVREMAKKRALKLFAVDVTRDTFIGLCKPTITSAMHDELNTA
ncbi:glycosyltransferase [Serratia sp. UGAL515B_01]|uniref:glycosyltransferase n=1 Tax=Serratia sp. UGAL515B_01 TaxID=2986763 RepID=UPI0029540B18|nr:glycosyltransferase [Serratia sp. UGAL515B_01]WON78274.1 glycosyltransferase [Serratia sp. UGAL515B_01]